MLISIPQYMNLEISDTLSDFERLIVEIPLKKCFVGMLLTCPIIKLLYKPVHIRFWSFLLD